MDRTCDERRRNSERSYGRKDGGKEAYRKTTKGILDELLATSYVDMTRRTENRAE